MHITNKYSLGILFLIIAPLVFLSACGKDDPVPQPKPELTPQQRDFAESFAQKMQAEGWEGSYEIMATTDGFTIQQVNPTNITTVAFIEEDGLFLIVSAQTLADFSGELSVVIFAGGYPNILQDLKGSYEIVEQYELPMNILDILSRVSGQADWAEQTVNEED